MAHKTIKEMLELMLENKDMFRHGLCQWATNMWWSDSISIDEHTILTKYIDYNPPSRIKSGVHKGYYWQAGDIAPRIRWIRKHIKLNK